MSVASLCRHRAAVHRSVETRDATTRAVVRTWSVLVSSMLCEVQKKAAGLGRGERRDPGGGEISDGDWIVYVPDTSLDIVAGDIIVTTSGDNHPLTLKIQHAYAPRKNHREFSADVWEGSLT